MARVRWQPAPYGSAGAEHATVARRQVAVRREPGGAEWRVDVGTGAHRWCSWHGTLGAAKRAGVRLARALARPPL